MKWASRRGEHVPSLENLTGNLSPHVTAVFRRAFRSGESSFRSRVNLDPLLLKLGFEAAVASTRCGRRGAAFQPVVCPATLPTRFALWFPRWFQATPLEASRRPPSLPMQSMAIVAMGIIVGVLAVCFRFLFDQTATFR